MKREKEAKEDGVLARRGEEMLKAARVLEQTLQGPAMSEFFRSIRTEGCGLCD